MLHQLSSCDLEALEQMGWTRDSGGFIGEFRTDFGSFAGLIRSEHGIWSFYILDCPKQVLVGRHRACFRGRPSFKGRTVHWIHFSLGPLDPISGILAVNQVLQDALIESPANDTGD